MGLRKTLIPHWDEVSQVPGEQRPLLLHPIPSTGEVLPQSGGLPISGGSQEVQRVPCRRRKFRHSCQSLHLPMAPHPCRAGGGSQCREQLSAAVVELSVTALRGSREATSISALSGSVVLVAAGPLQVQSTTTSIGGSDGEQEASSIWSDPAEEPSRS